MNKRVFDFFLALLLLALLLPALVVIVIMAGWDTGSTGIFLQWRVGRHGRLFRVIKIRTVHKRQRTISRLGNWFRNQKADEFPQLLNIIIGQMSFVGPRPDIPGYYDKLSGEERKILELRPGLTSEASLRFYDEEQLLKSQKDPVKYNNEVIFPIKVKLNLEYYYHRNFLVDLRLIYRTVFRSLG